MIKFVEFDASELIVMSSLITCYYMYVQDKFKIQIRASETSVGSFQFVLLHHQDLFRNVFALKFENISRIFWKFKRSGDKIHVMLNTIWKVFFLPSSRFYNFFFHSTYFFSLSMTACQISQFSQFTWTNLDKRVILKRFLIQSKITKEQFRVMTAISFRTTVRSYLNKNNWHLKIQS